MAILQIPVTKGGKDATIEFDTDSLPEAVYAEAVIQGLKVLVNRGTSKITKSTYSNPDELKAAAVAKAEEQKVEMLKVDADGKYIGKTKLTGQKAKTTTASGKVKTEARRLAREIVRDLMKKNGIKISHVKASQITALADDLIEQDPTLLAQAEANLAAREATPTPSISLDTLKAMVDPKLVAADEAKKAAERASRPLSAKQAGKTKKRPGVSA